MRMYPGGGWVLMFSHSLNNKFAWTIFYFNHTRVRWLVLKYHFFPLWMLSTAWIIWKTKNKCCVFCSLKVLSYYLTYLSFVYVFVLLHAVKSNYNRIHIFDRFMYQLYHGSSNTAWPSPTHGIWMLLDMSSYKRGGVSMIWGYLLPYNIPWQY